MLKAVNMPKTNVESAIKRASEKDSSNFDEIVYEGYGPYGLLYCDRECATDILTKLLTYVYILAVTMVH